MARAGNSFILFLALVSGFAAFMFSLKLAHRPSQEAAVKIENLVVVAVEDIGIGSIIQKNNVELLPSPTNVNPKMVFKEADDVLGRVSRRNILKGEAVQSIDLLAEGDNLASLIPDGYRAMTIPVVLSSNLKNLLQIGNRLDVILTYDEGRESINSVTLIQNARVIGVSEPSGGGGAARSVDKEVQITLAVSPEGAETLAYGMQKGTLNVSIRSLSESDDEKFFTLKELFFPEKKNDLVAHMPEVTERLPTDEIEIIRGIRREEYSYEE